MKNKMIELVFILDRSGSMSGLESDTIGGFNGMLEKQKKNSGEGRITTVLFDDSYEILHDRLDIRAVSDITSEEYYVRGSTALLDAIGKTIQKIDHTQGQVKEAFKADQVLFVITTDGMENASREYSAKQIKKMINRQKEEKNWEFLFLGANIDAIDTAEKLGIAKNRASNYHADTGGLKTCFTSIDKTISSYRSSCIIEDDWKEEIEADYKKRS